VQDWTDRTGGEASSADIWAMFQDIYLGEDEVACVDYRTLPEAGRRALTATVRERGGERVIEGKGSGPLDAFVDALRRSGIAEIAVLDYHEHALGAGSDAQAAAYVEAKLPDGRVLFGVGLDRNIVTASLKAVASVASRARRGV
jgi:2-isopropylmalate synthase